MASHVPTVPVDGIAHGDHACCAFAADAVHEELVAGFVQSGLERGERVLYFADDASPRRVLEVLDRAGIATASALACRQLVVRSAQRAYLGCAEFDPERVIASFHEAIDQALADGFAGLSSSAETAWAGAEPPGIDQVLAYEAGLGAVCATRPVAALCQLDRRCFDGRLVDAAVAAHPLAVDSPVTSPDGLLRVVPLATDRDGNLRVRLAGEADMSNSDLLAAALAAAVHERGDVHLELTRLDFVDLRGIEALRTLADRLRAGGRQLVLHDPPASFTRTLAAVESCLPDVEIAGP